MCTELLMLKLTMNGQQQKVYWEDYNKHKTEFLDWGASFYYKTEYGYQEYYGATSNR